MIPKSWKLTALFFTLLVAPIYADTTGVWVSDSTGLTIDTPFVNYSTDYPWEGTVSVSGGGFTFGAEAGYLEFDTGLVTLPSSTPVSWSSPLNWDSPAVPFQYFDNIVNHAEDGSISYGTNNGFSTAYPSLDDLIHGGPTEGDASFSVPVPDVPLLSLSVGTKVEFDVHIDTGQIVNVDQNAAIKDFTVATGAAADILNGYNLTVNGNFANTGSISIESGGTLTRSADTANYGSMTLNGGALNVSGTFNNNGSFQFNSGTLRNSFVNSTVGNFNWTGGTESGNLTNNGQITISGTNGGQTVEYYGALTNHGTITQQGNASVWFDDTVGSYGSANGGIINNATDGIYNLTGDGNMSRGYGVSFAYNGAATYNDGLGGGTINNAGLFEKTGGSGVSVVDPYIVFNNTGTVKVDSGTIELQGGGTSTGGTFVFSNGGSVRLNSGYTFSGLNSGSGDGILEIAAGNLSVSAGDTATLNFTGESEVLLSGGSIGGTGAMINAGTFTWTGGNVNGGGNGTGGLTNEGSMLISGVNRQTVGYESLLTNHGTITQQGNASVWFDDTVGSYGSANGGIINNATDGIYNLTGDGNMSRGYGVSFAYNGAATYNDGLGGGTINNAGLFEKTGGSGTSVVDPYVVFNNTGTVEVDSGTLSLQGGVTQQSGNTLMGGTWNVKNNSTLSFVGEGEITTNKASVTLSGANSNFTNFNLVNNNQGSFNLSNGRSFTTVGNLANSGQVNIDKTSSLNVNGTFSQTATGSLAGEGALTGNASLSGTIEAGDAGLTINGNLTLNSDGILKFDLGSINVQGNLTLDNANLSLNLALGNSPLAHGTQLTLLTYTGTETGLLDYNGIALQDGSLFNYGVNTFQISYAFGDPSVTLTIETVPEPSTCAMLGIGVVLLAFTARSKKSLISRNQTKS